MSSTKRPQEDVLDEISDRPSNPQLQTSRRAVSFEGRAKTLQNPFKKPVPKRAPVVVGQSLSVRVQQTPPLRPPNPFKVNRTQTTTLYANPFQVLQSISSSQNNSTNTYQEQQIDDLALQQQFPFSALHAQVGQESGGLGSATHSPVHSHSPPFSPVLEVQHSINSFDINCSSNNIDSRHSAVPSTVSLSATSCSSSSLKWDLDDPSHAASKKSMTAKEKSPSPPLSFDRHVTLLEPDIALMSSSKPLPRGKTTTLNSVAPMSTAYRGTKLPQDQTTVHASIDLSNDRTETLATPPSSLGCMTASFPEAGSSSQTKCTPADDEDLMDYQLEPFANARSLTPPPTFDPNGTKDTSALTDHTDNAQAKPPPTMTRLARVLNNAQNMIPKAREEEVIVAPPVSAHKTQVIETLTFHLPTAPKTPISTLTITSTNNMNWTDEAHGVAAEQQHLEGIQRFLEPYLTFRDELEDPCGGCEATRASADQLVHLNTPRVLLESLLYTYQFPSITPAALKTMVHGLTMTQQDSLSELVCPRLQMEEALVHLYKSLKSGPCNEYWYVMGGLKVKFSSSRKSESGQLEAQLLGLTPGLEAVLKKQLELTEDGHSKNYSVVGHKDVEKLVKYFASSLVEGRGSKRREIPRVLAMVPFPNGTLKQATIGKSNRITAGGGPSLTFKYRVVLGGEGEVLLPPQISSLLSLFKEQQEGGFQATFQ